MKESFILIGFGIILLIVGLIMRKYPEKYLEIFGAKILILFKKENRINATRLIGLAFMVLGIIMAIIGLLGFFR